jgi:pilus assembly protein CpaF
MIPDAVFAKTLLGFLAPIAPLLADERVSEVMINAPDEVFVERNGRVEPTEVRFPSPQALEAAVRNLAQYAGQRVDERHPVLEARLPDGSRVCAVVPPASRRGICLTIRRLPQERLTVEQLLKAGALSYAARDFLYACVMVKKSILVAGGAGAGKTTLVNALTSFVPEKERLVVVEEAGELTPPHPHVVSLQAKGGVTMRELLRAAVRLRPDRIVAGEVRGAEAAELVQAMTSGHAGSLASVHASHPHDALHRLEVACLMADAELPLSSLRAQIASAVNVVVQAARLNDGSRKVTHIAECVGLEKDRYHLRTLFEFRQAAIEPQSGRVLGALVPTGERPMFTAELTAHGLQLPSEMLG